MLVGILLIEYPMSLSLHGSPYWCDTVVVVVVGDSMHPQVILLAMLTMKKQTQGFHNFYTWFSSVSAFSIGTGLSFPAPLGWRSSAMMG